MLDSFFEKVFQKLDIFLNNNWLLKTWFCAIILTIGLSGPSIKKFNLFFNTYPVYTFLSSQIKSPFEKQNVNKKSHEANRTFRLFMPVLASLTGISYTFLVILQSIFGTLFFFIVAKTSFKYSQDKIISFLFTIGFTGLYIGKSFTLDYWSFFDGTAFFFLLLSIHFTKPLFIFFSLLPAFWTDERAVVASINVIVFHTVILVNNSRKRNEFFNIYLAIISVIAMYLIGRLFLIEFYKLETGNSGIGILWLFSKYFKYVPISIFMFYESYWVYLILAFLVLFKEQKNKIITGLFILGIVIQSFVALSVGDMVRSGAYLLVPCFTSFFLITSFENSLKVKRIISLLACISALLIPTYSFFGSRIIWMKPDWYMDFF